MGLTALLHTVGCTDGANETSIEPTGNGGSASDSGSGGAGGTGATGSTGAVGGTGGSLSGGGGIANPAAWVQVDDGTTNPEAWVVDMAIGPDGAVYVLWLDNDTNDIMVARSTDNGQSFEPAAVVDDETIDPLILWNNQPYVIADDTRVVVVYPETPPEGARPKSYIAQAQVGAATLSFAERVQVGATSDPKKGFGYARAAYGLTGEVWIGFDAEIKYSQTNWGHEMGFARESDGYLYHAVSIGDDPCDCCRSDLFISSTGDRFMGYRAKTSQGRQMQVVGSPAAASDFTWSAAVHQDWWDMNVCPQQGPRLDELSDGTLLFAGSDMQTGTQEAYLATSTDGGTTWSAKVPMTSGVADPRSPQIAVDEEDRIWATITNVQESILVISEDGGQTWLEPMTLASPDGALAGSVVRSVGGQTLVAGVTPSGAVYVHSPEPNSP